MKFLKNVLIQKKATKERKINIIGRTNGTDCNMVYMDATLSVTKDREVFNMGYSMQKCERKHPSGQWKGRVHVGLEDNLSATWTSSKKGL